VDEQTEVVIDELEVALVVARAQQALIRESLTTVVEFLNQET
jgi:hypothetical protein